MHIYTNTHTHAHTYIIPTILIKKIIENNIYKVDIKINE